MHGYVLKQQRKGKPMWFAWPKVTASGLRFWTPILVGVALGVLFWLRPGLALPRSPEMALYGCGGIFLAALMYLVIQAHPISHGNIGSASAHTVDNIISIVPGLVAIFGLFSHLVGFWPLSFYNVFIALVAIGVVLFDVFSLGGAAAKINRLTDEYKAEK